ncbi:MAG: ParB/RepB/Spo0J family partition protein [Propionicimonas sp.]|uniref:ParB/RepB/Spo0J family partition protein n=1 Tax=Propionicimonas sp. TaxID=1955623 RepID=UPI002B1F1515|nr:ParB/RepB/Spo0J family partition protein [Propionicimonas sp.]MEA4944450.1 ParB/RepB/Spo0J family partition protein [Propionicimonas sp.]MEA5055553.1 ParB/RepB/Spo0J family partition protein [Propionicimonas sp.]
MNAPKNRSGLGRGLGDLLQRTDPDLAPRAGVPEVPAGSRYEEIPVSAVRPNPKQPRTVFDEDALAELAASIAEIGLLQPIVVRPLGDGQQYELVMGERRLRATQLAGETTIPAIVRRTEDADLLRDALLENLHRAQLNPLEEAAAYQQLLNDFGCTQEELSQRIKRSRPQISNTIRLLQLPTAVQRKVAAGVISAGHARALLMLATPEAMDQVAQRVVAENLSVRAVEELVAVGEPQAARRAPRRTRSRELPAAAAEAQEALVEALDTRVTVATSGKRGKIVIEFADLDDLQRIADLVIKR